MLQKPKILVVDNDATFLRQMKTILREMGTAPRCLSSSPDAVEAINREKFDGVFLTWSLRELDGRRLTQRIRKSRSNARVPIALLSERGSVRTLSEAFESGVTFAFGKPVGPIELRRLVSASRGAMLEERRRYQRAPLGVPVSCAWEKKLSTGEAVNISSSGLLLRLGECPEPGSAVRLDFNLPAPRKRLEVEALVARATPTSQIGVMFMGLSQNQQMLIKDYTDRALDVQRVF